MSYPWTSKFKKICINALQQFESVKSQFQKWHSVLGAAEVNEITFFYKSLEKVNLIKTRKHIYPMDKPMVKYMYLDYLGLDTYSHVPNRRHGSKKFNSAQKEP